MASPPPSGPFAFVSLLTSDHYLPGALALAGALKDVHPSPAVAPEVEFQTVCLVTPESVDVSSIKQLRRAFDVVVGVELIAQEDDKGLKLLGMSCASRSSLRLFDAYMPSCGIQPRAPVSYRGSILFPELRTVSDASRSTSLHEPLHLIYLHLLLPLGRLDLNTVLTKLHVFRLTQYSKIIFLDADVLPIRPLSHLFTLPHEFSAVPDVGWPDIFNSGVLVLSPGEEKFTQLNELLQSKGTWDGGDQGILNEWRGGDWNRLSFTYNTTPTAAYTYAPAYERFGSQISAIHFIGPNKPWKSLSYRPPFQSHGIQTDSGPLQAYDYNALVDRWFAIYDKYCRAAPTVSESEFEVKRYISAWDEQTGTGSELISESMTSGTALGLEDLRNIAIHGMAPGGPPSTGEGEYRRLPLEGRFDLMRPQKQQETAEKAEEQQGRVDSGNLTTPRPSRTRSESPPRWETLPTPGPDEVPPSPRLPIISLPPTPTPASYAQKRHDQAQPPQHTQQPQHQQQPPHQHQPQPRRPASPPMLIWNAATDPPPTTAPPPSAFPSETYFPNIWDQPQQTHHRQGPRAPSPPPDSNAFFQPPPPSEIPESLRLQGHYRQVTGEEELGAKPSPDRTKVKHVFPWEDKPRQMPGRVFPTSDAPSPSLFMSPMSPGTPDSIMSQPRSQQLSPLHGLPATLTYANAWDTVPSIQKYASRLVRPPQSPVPLAPAFEGDRYRKGRSWDDRTEASSMDGDDEDDGEDDDDSLDDPHRARGVPDSDSDRDTTKGSTTVRSRGSSISATYSIKGKKKEYTVRGVQTISPKYRSQGTQASDTAKVSTHEKRPSRSDGRRQWAPSAADVLSPVTVYTGADLSMTTASPSPALQQPGSPREFTFASPTSVQPEMLMSTPPPRPAVAPVERHTSNDDSLTSPPSSIGPISPPDAPLAISPIRKGSRVWDPRARRGAVQTRFRGGACAVPEDGLVGGRRRAVTNRSLDTVCRFPIQLCSYA
ncbi:glycosyltransferase family 8 protein [Mycena alexandri]|uniref:Glycosyltransferase family 8 protein n=1 Tax=Mycena alexandri TaxID=1745969 RepID=A0AAD6T7R3_9AGAR|nr:glycosyltransferase family 8 protein [Mycena alexandri]